MKTAIVLPTAFVTTLPDRPNREERIGQYVRGFTQVAELVRKYPQLDVFASDGTIEDVTKIDARLIEALDRIPTLKGKCFFNDNEHGKKNKGAGLIVQLRKALSVMGNSYDYVISFEPRQQLEDYSFFERFIKKPQNYFRVERVMAKKYRLFPFLLIQVMTGLIVMRREELDSYVSTANLDWMVWRRVSIERDLYKFLLKNQIPFEEVDYLNVLWHDSANNKIIRL